MSDLDPTMLARIELLPQLSSRIADTLAQRLAVEVYFAAADNAFGTELPSCEHDRAARPGIEAAGTYVCVCSTQINSTASCAS